MTHFETHTEGRESPFLKAFFAVHAQVKMDITTVSTSLAAVSTI